MVRLGDVCEKKVATISSKSNCEIDYIDIAAIDNISKSILTYKNMDVEDAPSRARQILKINDILVSTVRPNLNAIAIVKRKSDRMIVGSTGFCVLRCTSKAITEYAFYFCQSKLFIQNLLSVAKGASYPAVTDSDVKNIEIPLPPLEIQKKIAQTLDVAAELIALYKKQLAELDNLIKATFYDMFGDPVTNEKGWPIVNLNVISESFIGLTYKPEEVSDKGIIVLRSGNIQNNILDFRDTIRVDKVIRDKLLVQRNDILMCSRNGSHHLVGKTTLIDKTDEPMSFGAFMTIIRSKYYRYLLAYFRTDAFRRQIFKVHCKMKCNTPD